MEAADRLATAERPLAGLGDGQLVGRCRRGDEAAWSELVVRFSRYVYAIATQVYRLPEHEAEDVFQDTFARAWTHLPRLRDDEAIRPWIGQLTRRRCVDALRAGAREEPTDAELEPSGADDSMARLDESLDVHEALAALPGHCREVVDRFFVRDESYATIGTALDLPPGTIASRISRCLGRLRELLEGRSPAPAPSGGHA